MQLLHELATEIAEETFSESDTSTQQLERNLVSLIGQKSVEMNMLANLVSMKCDELKTHYETTRIQIQRIDLLEAAELVRRSRKIILALLEAVEFEENFTRIKSIIPKAVYLKTTIAITRLKKAMIYTLHYIEGKQSAAANVKQSLRKNMSFRALAYDLDVVLLELTTLGVLTIEQRVKRRRVVNPIRRHVNEIRIVERRQGFFKTRFNENNENHRNFLDLYQCIYPGALFGVD